MVEAVHIEKPEERAYLDVADMADMRGQMLEDYVDQKLEIFGEQVKKRKRKDE